MGKGLFFCVNNEAVAADRCTVDMPEKTMVVDISNPQFWIAVMQIIAIDIVLGGDNAVVIALACRRLPERQRSAVVLRHIEGLTNPEIAEILQIGVEAVESLTARGKRALTLALAGQRAELGYEEAE